jgi:hypothetical protein
MNSSLDCGMEDWRWVLSCPRLWCGNGPTPRQHEDVGWTVRFTRRGVGWFSGPPTTNTEHRTEFGLGMVLEFTSYGRIPEGQGRTFRWMWKGEINGNGNSELQKIGKQLQKTTTIIFSDRREDWVTGSGHCLGTNS